VLAEKSEIAKGRRGEGGRFYHWRLNAESVFDLTHNFGVGFGLPAPQISNRFRSCPRSGEDLQIIFGELSETYGRYGGSLRFRVDKESFFYPCCVSRAYPARRL